MSKQYIFAHVDGDIFYYKDPGKTILHRLDGPAIEWANGAKEWFVNGELHRLDGPAVEYADDGKTWWYVNGVLIFVTNKEGNILYRMR